MTERARETFKRTIDRLASNRGTMLRIGPTAAGLGFFPDNTVKEDDQVIEHEGRPVLLVDHELSEGLGEVTIDVEEHSDGSHFVLRK